MRPVLCAIGVGAALLLFQYLRRRCMHRLKQEAEQKKLPSFEHAVIVLGFVRRRDSQPTQALKCRLDAAKEAYDALRTSNGEDTVCLILTGGDPPHRYEAGAEPIRHGVTEAETMRSYLCERGVTAAHVFQETRARYTIENGFLVRDMLDECPALRGVDAIHLVTNAFHLTRSQLIFDAAFEHCEPHQRPVAVHCVGASDGDAATLEAETGRSLAEWREAHA